MNDEYRLWLILVRLLSLHVQVGSDLGREMLRPHPISRPIISPCKSLCSCIRIRTLIRPPNAVLVTPLPLPMVPCHDHVRPFISDSTRRPVRRYGFAGFGCKSVQRARSTCPGLLLPLVRHCQRCTAFLIIRGVYAEPLSCIEHPEQKGVTNDGRAKFMNGIHSW